MRQLLLSRRVTYLCTCWCAACVASEQVVVIGAGASGIAAATRLLEAGVTDIVVLEARDVIGGRMKHGTIGGATVELGCNWIQGTSTSNWLTRLKDRYHVSCNDTDWDSMTLYNESGHEVTWNTSRFEAAFEELAKLSAELQADCAEDLSVSEALKKAGYEARTDNKYDMWMMVNFFDYENAAPPSRTSLQNTYPLWTYKDFGEEECFVNDQRGWSSMFEAWAADSGVHDKIAFNQVVNRITYNDSGVVVHTGSGMYFAEHVIVTAPLGVLQSDSLHFQPPLPAWKVDSVQKFGMDTYIKIYLQFPEKFWPDTEFQYFISPERDYYLIWQNMNYVKQHGNKPPYVYMVTVLGEQGRRVENQSRSETIEEVVDVLRSMYPAEDVPMPLDVLSHSWDNDPYAKGSYSYWPYGITKADHDRLCAPVGRLWYAGEHCHNKYRPFVHGAMYSGNDTASAVVQCINDSDRCPSIEAPASPACMQENSTKPAEGARTSAPMATPGGRPTQVFLGSARVWRMPMLVLVLVWLGITL